MVSTVNCKKTLQSEDAKNIQRQAFAGMLWSKQFFYYDIPQWLKGDPVHPSVHSNRLKGEITIGCIWTMLTSSVCRTNGSIPGMPHGILLSIVSHLPRLMHNLPRNSWYFTREWYMHPNGQLPAYEWEFGDVNPPVHAWATWRVYRMEQEKLNGKGDVRFLESVFQKLLLNFTWW